MRGCRRWLRWRRRSALAGLVADQAQIVDAPNSGGANAGAKVISVLAGLVARGDCITGTDRLRYAGMPIVFDGVRALSTVETFPAVVHA